ncbi:hypothetical protein JCM10207_008602 [Rhodosporidiobolus poonsookiae]
MRRLRQARPNAAQELNKRQEAALEELRLFRTTLDSLRARLPGLEHFVANASLREEDSAELDAIVKTFGDPVTELSALREEEGDDPLAGPSISPVFSRKPSTSQGVDLLSSRNGNGGASTSSEPPRKKARLSQPKKEEEQSGSNVEAAVSLEFYTLGRPRTWTEANLRAQDENGDSDEGPDPLSSPTHRLAVLAPEPPADTPLSRFPDGASLQAVQPGEEAETALLSVGLDQYGFHHAVVHAPSFRAQRAAFHQLEEDKFLRASPAWLSLYFALLAVSAKLISREETAELGWTDEEMFRSASSWFDCSIACLYRANFLQVHDFSCLQAIAVLVLSGRDAGSATLIASLLYSGLSIVQDLGLHRLPSDEQWDAALKGKPVRVRAKSLIDREIRKRVVWALVHSEWFAIPFKGYSLLSKVQISTPLPLNATDEDLATGELVDRDRDEYTSAAWLLRYIEIGGFMAKAFEFSATDKTTASAAYAAFLEADKQLEGLLSDIPRWLRKGEDSTGLPTAAETIRSTFLISLNHKILSIHRPFLARPSRATTYAFSRRRVIEAARAILREAPLVYENRIWTSIYHVSVALFSLTLELYEQLKESTADNEAIRKEIQDALPTLEGLKSVSAIAERGLGLVLPLLADEQRMRDEGGQLKEKRKGKAPATSRTTSARTISTAPSLPVTANHSPTLPSPLPLPGSLFASVSPDPTGTANPHLPFFPPAAPNPYAAPTGPGGAGYPVPPWLYNEQFLYTQLSGLDGTAAGGSVGGSGSGTPGPAAAFSGAYGLPGGVGGPFGAVPGAGLGMGGMGVGAMGGVPGVPAPWGMMPPMGGYGAAGGWDWMNLGAAGLPGGVIGEESPGTGEAEGV